MSLEREWKLIAAGEVSPESLRSIAIEHGLLVAPPTTRQHADVYLDTAGDDLARAGLALRLREEVGERARRQRKLTVKSAGRRQGGLAIRAEREAVWNQNAPPRTARQLPDGLRHWVEPIALAQPLQEVARLEIERTAQVLQHGSTPASAEACIDRVVLPEAARRFCEVEVEITGPQVEPFAPLVSTLKSRLELEDSELDKLARARALLRRPLPRAPREKLRRKTLWRDAALLTLRAWFAEARQHEAGTRLALDPEDLHDMRVATRRMRAALRTFGAGLQAAELEFLRRLLRRTGRALGSCRERDVLLAGITVLRERLPAELLGDIDALVVELQREREWMHRRLLRWLCSEPRLNAMQHAQDLFLHPLAWSGESARVAQLAPIVVLRQARKLFQLGRGITPDSPPERLHELRIAGKRLRYSAETFRSVFPGLEDLIGRLVQVQEALGTFRDAEDATTTLTTLLQRGGARRAAIGALLGAQAARSQAAIANFHAAWRRLDRKKVRVRLQQALAGEW
jgi:CHAD domain-containing protein